MGRIWSSVRMNYLSVCTILRNEELYSREWVEHLLAQGAQHFYLYDNSVPGEPDQRAPLKEYEKYITWHNAPGLPMQRSICNHTINNYKDDTELVIFMDCDEFPYSKKHSRLIETLPDYFSDESISALAIHWLNFGSSGREDYSPEPVVKRFIRREEKTNPHVKSICRLSDTRCMANDVHSYRVMGDIIDENFNYLVDDYALSEPATSNILAMNHYVTKSKNECIKRRSFPRCDTGELRDSNFFEGHDRNDVEDTYLRDLIYK